MVEVNTEVARQVMQQGVALLSNKGRPEYAVIDLASYEELQEFRSECRQARREAVRAFIQEHRVALLELAK